jgi:hypothetical protein
MSDQMRLAQVTLRLEDAQRRLYEVFGRVARPKRVEGCPHCVTPGEERCLLEGPVASIEAADLARYAAKALTTWGGTADLRYFLPRLLECAADDAFVYPDPEIVFGKLAAADWQHWPGDEPDAISDFLFAWWSATLHRDSTWPPIGTILCCLAATGSDLAPYLQAWSRLDTQAAVRHLHDLLVTDVRWTPSPRLTNAFWDRGGTPHHQLLTWLSTGPAAGAVEAAFDRETREPVLDLLATIHPWVTPPEHEWPTSTVPTS